MGRLFHTGGAPNTAQTLTEVEAPPILLYLAAFFFSGGLMAIWFARRQSPHQAQDQDFHLELEQGGATVVERDSSLSPKRHKNPVTSLPAEIDYEPPSGASPETCTVCTEDLAAGEKVRRLPRCSHVFHRDCIDPWLADSPTCPVCRSEVEDDHQLYDC